ncbi:hypothetical protein GCM10017744_101540 [Streptomyces antimycoticus]
MDQGHDRTPLVLIASARQLDVITRDRDVYAVLGGLHLVEPHTGGQSLDLPLDVGLLADLLLPLGDAATRMDSACSRMVVPFTMVTWEWAVRVRPSRLPVILTLLDPDGS